MPAQGTAQGSLQQVGGGMIARDIRTPLSIYFRLDAFSHGYRAPDYASAMADQVASYPCRVFNFDCSARPGETAFVADLSAHFSVERGSVKHHLD